MHRADPDHLVAPAGGSAVRPPVVASPRPALPGLLTHADLVATAASIAEAQEPDGAIPWFAGGHTDPWDHVESAMALDVMGLHAQALDAYEWLRRRQRPDGSWPARLEQGVATGHHVDSNFCGYVAVGVWHHHLATSAHPSTAAHGPDGRPAPATPSAFLARMWPTVRRALDLVVGLQLPGGGVAWTTGAGEALLAGSSSLYQALRCGLAIADAVGCAQPDWELAAGRLGHALRRHPERFADKARWSMDWYYPILGGAVRGEAARDRIAGRWDDFWVPGLGIRCVSDRPWVTGAETCELVIALEAIGERGTALEVLSAMQHLRDDSGAYWTGYVFTDDARWPVERSTWTAAAVVLAADALSGPDLRGGIFRGDALPVGVDPDDVRCADEAIERSSGQARSAGFCNTLQ